MHCHDLVTWPIQRVSRGLLAGRACCPEPLVGGSDLLPVDLETEVGAAGPQRRDPGGARAAERVKHDDVAPQGPVGLAPLIRSLPNSQMDPTGGLARKACCSLRAKR